MEWIKLTWKKLKEQRVTRRTFRKHLETALDYSSWSIIWLIVGYVLYMIMARR